jgi:hypothetical protein
VTIGHKGSSSSSASRVYTQLKQSISTSVKLGTLTIKKVGAGKQGYAVASTTSSSADTSVGAQVSASKGRPTGVGTYGKTSGVAIKSYGVSATAFGDPCSPSGTPTCGPDGKEIGTPNPGQQGTQQGAVLKKDETLGGDADDDGIPNAPQHVELLISKSSPTTRPHKVVMPEQLMLMPLAHSKPIDPTSRQQSQKQ